MKTYKIMENQTKDMYNFEKMHTITRILHKKHKNLKEKTISTCTRWSVHLKIPKNKIISIRDRRKI